MATKQKVKQNQQQAVSAKVGQSGNSLKKYYYLFGVLTFFLFANTLGNGYNMDDGMVTRNHTLTSKGLSAIGEIFTSPYYSDAMGYAYGYRPMVHLSFALEHDLFGEKPGAGHFINVLLFAFSVVLFFKLLVKWVGEKNALFAGIATLLFAVHPIHTEVVASLKNRDEILAFLFVIWSALSLHKYLSKNNWLSIVIAFILFSLAMLSKKSIYPMAVILPIAIILLKDISIKQLIILSAALIIPASIIGSELKLDRMIVMFALPAFFIFIAYYMKGFLKTEGKVSSGNSSLYILLIGITLFLSMYTSVLFMIISIPLFFLLFKAHFQHGVITLMITLIGLDFLWLSNYELQLLAMLLGLVNCIHLMIKEKTTPVFWISVAALFTAYFLYHNHDIGNIVLVIHFIILSVVLQKKPIIGLIIIGATIITAFIMSGLPTYSIYLLIYGLTWYLYHTTKNNNWMFYFPLIGLCITLSIISYQQFQQKDELPQLTENSSAKQSEQSSPTNFLKEGRELLYAENTLVALHTQSEKIATGFLSVGEYFRLHIYPQELSFYYGYAKIKTVDLKHPMVLISIVVHLFLIFLAVWQIRKRPLITIGIMWYLMSILLFSNWVELVAGMVGERLAFTGSAGFCILIAGIIYWVKPNFDIRKPGIIGAVLGIAIILLTARTFVRNTNWKDTLTLMSHDIKHLENSAQANNLYAMTLMSNSMTEKQLTPAQKLEMQRAAISHYDKATQIWPDFFNAYIDKGRATIITKEYDKGIQSLKKAIEIDPENVLPYYILLDITEQKGDYQAYLDNTKQLFKIQQTDYVYGVMARGYFLLKEYAKSKEILLEGLKKYPGNQLLGNNLKIVEEQTQ